MRTFPNKKIRQLRKAGDLTEKDGRRYKPTRKEKPVKASLTSEERQAQALEAIVIEIKSLLQANSQNAVVLLRMIEKIKTDTHIEIPEQIKAWDCTPYRGGNGKIERIRIQAVK